MEHFRSPLAVTLAQYSDKGQKAENQDTIGARIPGESQGSLLITKGIALAVADGVSSSESARQASQTAVTGFLTDYYATPDTWSTSQSATQVIQSLNRYLWSQSQNSVRGEGFLTTFSALILKGDKSFIFHIGDTRVYRVRGGQVELLTRDHNQRLNSNTTYLSRALGADPVLEIDVHSEEIVEGDVFVLTSDGIHDAGNSGQLQELFLRFAAEPERLVKEAVAFAAAAESKDNLSIQVARVDRTGTSSQSDAMTVLAKLPFPPLLQPGHKLDGLNVQKVLHESERSQVYLVKTPEGTPLVMKTPSESYKDDPAYIERFVLESWIGSRIQNLHVARVIQPPRARSMLYYLTEHVAGPALEQVIKERAPLEITDAVELIEQVVKGIRAFHRKDTLHQDIKPANIVIGAKGAVIIDFGSCWVAGIHEVGSGIRRDGMLGTLHYSAPEYRFGGAVSQKSDQFSLAVLLYEMLTKKHPYGERYSEIRDFKGFQRLNYIHARKHNPLVPIWLDKALEKALAIHPSARYAALSEWVKDLQRPNPAWLKPQETPLLERDPVRVWQVIALAGWLLALILLVQVVE